MGYQWKDNIPTFHWIHISTLCDQWFGHRDALKIGNFPLSDKKCISMCKAGFFFTDFCPSPTNGFAGFLSLGKKSLSLETIS